MDGTIMVQDGYLDQPYCQVLPEGRVWTCVITAAGSHEGGAGEHMISILSTDEGAKWSSPVAVEPPPFNLASAYGTLAVSRSGRLYCIYNCESISSLLNIFRFTRTA